MITVKWAQFSYNMRNLIFTVHCGSKVSLSKDISYLPQIKWQFQATQ